MSNGGTRTSAKARTSTLTRAEFLGKVMKYVAKSTVAEESLERLIEKGVVENQWVEVIHIWGLDHDGHIRAEILLRIDWERYVINVRDGNESIDYDPSRSPGDNLSRKLGAMIDIFTEVVAEKGLKPTWAVTFIREHYDVASKACGTSPSTHKWKPGQVSHIAGVNERKADELFADLRLHVSDGESDDEAQRSGVVVDFFSDRGYGFIRTDGESRDIFFHISSVDAENTNQVTAGVEVQFSTESGARGPRAVNVSIKD